MSDRLSPPPGGSAPEPGAKPTLPSQLAIATELWLVVVLGQAVAYASQYPTASDSVREAARNASSGASAEEIRTLTSTGTVVGVYVAVGVLLSVLSLLVVWLARTGHNWARMVLIFFSAFIVVQTVLGLFGDSAASWTTIPAVLSGVAALGAAWLLMQRDVETFCRAMAAFRKGGAGGGPPSVGQPPYPQQPYQAPQQPYQPPQQSYRPPTQPGHDPSARYDPHAHDTQGPPRYTPPPTAPGSYGAPPPLYPSYPERRSDGDAQSGGWEPARGENVRERRPGRPDDVAGDRPDTSGRDDRGE
ncbi:MAG: hypothetical protein INR72_12380 [Williamsia herbipolensis]|nr:hypothetical protein [Williamsia herbipolensis]